MRVVLMSAGFARSKARCEGVDWLGRLLNHYEKGGAVSSQKYLKIYENIKWSAPINQANQVLILHMALFHAGHQNQRLAAYQV